MKKFTTSDFRSNTSVVFNEVQENGEVAIVSRSRPEMILMTAKKLKEIKDRVSK